MSWQVGRWLMPLRLLKIYNKLQMDKMNNEFAGGIYQRIGRLHTIGAVVN